MNKSIMEKLGFNKEVYRVEQGICPFCDKRIMGVDDFKDKLSWKEYKISGLCQECQDSMFLLECDSDISKIIKE